MAARIPAQPAPTTTTSWVASTWMDATEERATAGREAMERRGFPAPCARARGRPWPTPAPACAGSRNAASRSPGAASGRFRPCGSDRFVDAGKPLGEVVHEQRGQITRLAVVELRVAPGGTRVEELRVDPGHSHRHLEAEHLVRAQLGVL